MACSFFISHLDRRHWWPSHCNALQHRGSSSRICPVLCCPSWIQSVSEELCVSSLFPSNDCLLMSAGIKTLPCPAFSPDLSPIEHLLHQWGWVVRDCHLLPQTSRQREEELQAEWINIHKYKYNYFVQSRGDATHVFATSGTRS